MELPCFRVVNGIHQGEMDELRTPAKAYIAGVAITAIGLNWYLIGQNSFPEKSQLILAAINSIFIAIAITFPLKIATKTNLSLHLSAVFMATLLFPPGIAMLCVGIGSALAHIFRRLPWKETIFNTAEVMLQAGLGGLLLVLGGWNFILITANPFTLIPIVLGVAAIIYVIEFLSVAIIVALQTGKPFTEVWHQASEFDTIEILAQFSLGMIAALLAEAHIWALPLLIPSALVVYRSTHRHLDLRQQARTLQYQAFHDALTGLPNRVLFIDRVDHGLSRLDRVQQKMLAVLFLDLDRFKVVNDSLGHDIGDQLLVAVAQRLGTALRPSDTIARLGGDEFTVLAEDLSSVDDAIMLANRIITIFQMPFLLKGHSITITTSIGIALGTSSRARTDHLLRDADIAMYRAKDTGKDRFEVFTDHMGMRSQTRLQQENDLRRAVEDQDFMVYYQPIVDLESQDIVGLEALIRWNHPELGVVSPIHFIPLAEEMGLIHGIGHWVLDQACHQMQKWNEEILQGRQIYLAVNLSAKQFQQPHLVEDIIQTLHKSGLSPQQLQLELTESILPHDTILTNSTLRQLQDLGVQIAIDDFGTGYSSLSYLKRFPVKTVKIDRDFIEGLGHNSGDTAIVRTVGMLAHMLDILVVAEGIEDSQQVEDLKRLGYTLGQGFYFSPPLSGNLMHGVLAQGIQAQSLAGVAYG